MSQLVSKVPQWLSKALSVVMSKWKPETPPVCDLCAMTVNMFVLQRVCSQSSGTWLHLGEVPEVTKVCHQHHMWSGYVWGHIMKVLLPESKPQTHQTLSTQGSSFIFPSSATPSWMKSSVWVQGKWKWTFNFCRLLGRAGTVISHWPYMA